MAKTRTREQERIYKARARAKAAARELCWACLCRPRDPEFKSCTQCRETDLVRKTKRLEPISTTDDAALAAEEAPIHDAPGNY